MKGVSWTKWDERMTIEEWKTKEYLKRHICIWKKNKKNGAYSHNTWHHFVPSKCVWRTSEMPNVVPPNAYECLWRKSDKPQERTSIGSEWMQEKPKEYGRREQKKWCTLIQSRQVGHDLQNLLHAFFLVWFHLKLDGKHNVHLHYMQ